MQFIEIYLFLFSIVFIINLIPAFMPPTWIVLSFFYLQYHLLFFPTVILGVISAASGRITLALVVRKLKKYFPNRFIKNYEYLGDYLELNQKFTIPVILGYAFSPLSSNSLFIMAGLSNINLKIVALSFIIGRSITYPLWIVTSHQIHDRLDDILVGNLSRVGSFITVIVSVLIIIIIGKINWTKVIKLKR